MNLSKAGGSLSFGPRGAKFTVGSRGKRATVGIPGTGLFYTSTFTGGRSGGGKNASYVAPAVPKVSAESRLTLGFFKRFITPDDEEVLVDGCRELVLGDEDKALEHLEQAAHLADGAYLAGFMALRYERALVYEEMGQRKRARKEFEKLYADDPDYGDVAARLGL